MIEQSFKYIIAGAGLAGMSAIEGIRELDQEGTILLIGNENLLPYDRPPLSKKLWSGKKKPEDIFPNDSSFYMKNNIHMALGTELADLDAESRTLTDLAGNTYQYEKLLLATGGTPRKLDIPGGDTWGICYFRYFEDYLRIRHDTLNAKTAVIIGGGFIGSEIAAALNTNGIDVTMVFPESYLVSRVFPDGLGIAIQAHFREKGVKILAGDVPISIEKIDGKFVTATKEGKRLESDIVIAGLGIIPCIVLAEKAGLSVNNGIVVNEFLKTSDPDIYAAGDIANFPYTAIGATVRVEHWDNAINQGKQAGRNMTGINEPYDYMPYFWSDLFEFGYEAVGDLNSRYETFGDWQIENNTGVLYYLNKGKVCGVMTCNIYDKMDEARKMILSGRQAVPDDLRGAIKE